MELKSFLLADNDWGFLLDTAFRTTAMFIILLAALRLLGKKSVQQLSIFELGVIIGLGSAAGDPMIYKEVGIVPSIIVFVVVILMYRLINYLMGKSTKLEHILEGSPVYIIDEGRILMNIFQKEEIAREELYSLLRQSQVSHLGQVKHVILEVSGQVSIFFFEDKEVIPGLPILPHKLKKKQSLISKEGEYSCIHCSNTDNIVPGPMHPCPTCSHTEWVVAQKQPRVSC
ncbi:MAG: DUF421 domain-containing protein [Bacteroidota bacterium]|nr:DUF421 domain-containing protein [Bacteroidota bacterium]